MIASSKELKRRARAVLDGKYFLAASLTATTTLFALLSVFLLEKTGFASSPKPLYASFHWILGAIMLLLVSLVNAGLIKFIKSLSSGERMASGVLFYAFMHQPDTFLLVEGFRYLITLIWFVPALRKYLTLASVTELTQLPGILTEAVLLALPAVIPAVLLSLPYSQAIYLLLSDPEASATEVLKKSRALMKGNYLRLLSLYLSFLPWCFIIFTSGGFVSFWFRPYYYAAMCQFHEELIGQN